MHLISLQKKIITIIAIIFLFSIYNIGHVYAAEITQATVDDRNDFVLEPAKLEVVLNPGEKATRYIYVTSRINKPTKFSIEVEDFIGSDSADQPVVLLGNDKSPYSLKDYLKPEISDFTLNFGQKIKIPIGVDLPDNAPPGGFYASVLVSNAPDKIGNPSDGSASTKAISRVGALFFVKINGDVNEEGNLQDFLIKNAKSIYSTADMTFDILFKNTGSVHLVPYGTIDIKNIFGRTIDTLPVDAYFSLPQSLRYREVPWTKTGLVGYYTATLNLQRGYGNKTDTKTISIFIIPWKILLTLFVIVLIVLFGYYYMRRNFEFKRKG